LPQGTRCPSDIVGHSQESSCNARHHPRGARVGARSYSRPPPTRFTTSVVVRGATHCRSRGVSSMSVTATRTSTCTCTCCSRVVDWTEADKINIKILYYRHCALGHCASSACGGADLLQNVATHVMLVLRGAWRNHRWPTAREAHAPSPSFPWSSCRRRQPAAPSPHAWLQDQNKCYRVMLLLTPGATWYVVPFVVCIVTLAKEAPSTPTRLGPVPPDLSV
jgi:hypothetical protein